MTTTLITTLADAESLLEQYEAVKAAAPAQPNIFDMSPTGLAKKAAYQAHYEAHVRPLIDRAWQSYKALTGKEGRADANPFTSLLMEFDVVTGEPLPRDIEREDGF